MRGHRDLRLAVAVAALCAAGSLVVPLGALRLVFAAPLALGLPGYAIAVAAAGRRPIGWPELVPLSLALSLAALALGAILLNYAPGGIHGASWALLLLLVVAGGCRVAAVRRAPEASRRALALPRPRRATAILLAGAAALAIAALAIAQRTVHADRALGYTALWMTPTDRTGRVARIGVTSEQQQATAYRLEIRLGGTGRPAVRSFTLAPGESQVVSIDAGGSQRSTPVEAMLFKRGSPEDVYRQVHGWLPAGEEAPG